MVEHLCGAERHWCQGVARGFEDPLPFAEKPCDPDAPFVTDEPTDVVLGHLDAARELLDGRTRLGQDDL